jgi:GxxExxY protein
VYKSSTVDCGFRMDMVVEGSVIVELKAVEKVLAIHQAQLNTYLRLSGLRVGLLFNFNAIRLMDRFIRRIV